MIDETEYNACSWCGKVIRLGEAHVTINRNIEKAEVLEGSELGVITVIESYGELTLCTDCGDRLESSSVRDALERIGRN